MKLTTFFLLITFITVNASVYSQVTKLDLKVQSLTVKEVLMRIEDQSQFFFMYNDRKIDVERKVDFDLKKAKIEDLLNTIFEGTDTKFLIKDRQIVLYNESDEGFRVSNTESLTQQQKKTISGKVTDASGATLPGVSVVEKGTTNGVITDIDGKFSLANIPENATLQFSFVGMKLQEIAIGGKTSINVKLEEETIGIEEVVAIGYGVVKKSDLTGSVYQVTFGNENNKPVTSADQLLQGRVSGVQITQSSGAPGAGLNFIVRGGNSLGSNQPLIVLDGYPLDASSGSNGLGGDNTVTQQPQRNPLANINPSEIESIEILKDASSTAIYGSRGANGVVLITTKRGKKGQDIVQFNYRMDVSRIRKKIDVLNSNDFLNFANEGAANDGIDPIYTPAAVDSLSATSVNWQDEIYQTAISHDYQISLSGGDVKNKYSIVGSYLQNEGIVKNSDFDRGGIRLNYDRKVSDRLNVKLNVMASKSKSNMGLNSNTNGIASANVVASALLFNPYFKAYDASGEIDQTLADSPITVLNLTKDINENTLIITNAVLELKITKELTLKSNIGANNNDGIRQSYFPRGTFRGDQAKGYAYRNQSSRFNFLTENTMNYIKNIGKSNINGSVI